MVLLSIPQTYRNKHLPRKSTNEHLKKNPLAQHDSAAGATMENT